MSASTTRRGRAGLPTTARSAGCTPTPRCSSAGCAPCCCSRCIRWPWPGSPSTPITATTRGADLQRTSIFLAETTFGSAVDAQRAVDRVRGIHRRVHGVAADGRAYTATDPHLLEWVHIAEADSFLRAHQLYGAAPLDQAGRDGYVADMAEIAAKLGVIDPPRSERALAQRLNDFRPELHSTAAARDAARFLLLTPPLSLAARAPYGVLAATAVSMLPLWARIPLLLPYFPPVELTVVRSVGRVLVGGIRWALPAPARQRRPLTMSTNNRWIRRSPVTSG